MSSKKQGKTIGKERIHAFQCDFVPTQHIQLHELVLQKHGGFFFEQNSEKLVSVVGVIFLMPCGNTLVQKPIGKRGYKLIGGNCSPSPMEVQDDSGDSGPEDAVCRELEEEIGLPREITKRYLQQEI